MLSNLSFVTAGLKFGVYLCVNTFSGGNWVDAASGWARRATNNKHTIMIPSATTGTSRPSRKEPVCVESLPVNQGSTEPPIPATEKSHLAWGEQIRLIAELFGRGLDAFARRLRNGAPGDIVQHNGDGCGVEAKILRQLL